MPKLIKNQAVVDDSWTVLPATDAPETADIPASAVIVPLNVWKAHREELMARASTVGVWLNSDELAEQIANDAPSLPLIAINFPTFMDGRGFSAARLLRERYGFAGELRAIGGVIRDQLLFLHRCGFNSMALAEGTDLEAALKSFGDFTEFYQAACDQKLPLFRRRA